jgi:hypothetical protein
MIIVEAPETKTKWESDSIEKGTVENKKIAHHFIP